MDLPILYTFRRCPYAMRARMALAYAGVDYELREVVLRDKPEAMLALSAKGTVPVLQLADQVIDESLDVMFWGLAQSDDSSWLSPHPVVQAQTDALIAQCEDDFKVWLDRYKYNNRQPAYTRDESRQQGERFLLELEQRLKRSSGAFIFGQLGLIDVAVMPFVRQFAFVDKAWFDQSDYPELRAWLDRMLQSELFQSVMHKYAKWVPGQPVVKFSTTLAI